VGELATLDMDPVAIHDALRAFDSNRLVSFDRDRAAGAATVEVAHDALLFEWDRLKEWVEGYRSDIAMHQAFAVRVQEWEASNRGADDLLTGVRLDDCCSWAAETTIRLTAAERAFLDASADARDRTAAAAHEREAQRLRLENRARLRLLALFGTLALLMAAVVYGLSLPLGAAPDVVLVYPGPGAMAEAFDGIATGVDAAIARSRLDAQKVIETFDGLETRLRRLAAQGVDLVVVGFRFANPEVVRVARDYPEARFLALDYVGTFPNVSTLEIAREEGAFLIGTVAALRTRTGTVGILVDGDNDLDWPFPAGFAAGALAADAEATVRTVYLGSPPDYLVTYSMVNRAAHEMYRGGADVVFYAGGQAPLGVFEAAFSESEDRDSHLWAIAIDTDWYVALPMIGLGEGRPAEPWRAHVLTSLITRYDRAFETMVDAYAAGTLDGGGRRFGLAEGVFDVTASGGFIDDLQPRLDSLQARIVAGEIDIPPYPIDRAPPGVR
jgi:basic membrane protein A